MQSLHPSGSESNDAPGATPRDTLTRITEALRVILATKYREFPDAYASLWVSVGDVRKPRLSIPTFPTGRSIAIVPLADLLKQISEAVQEILAVNYPDSIANAYGSVVVIPDDKQPGKYPTACFTVFDSQGHKDHMQRLLDSARERGLLP
jgi:hypothetical protein